MESLIVSGDEVTPRIDFNGNTGRLLMSGLAIPENVREMFKPVKEWIDEYSKSPKPATELIFNFEYLNTAATKMVFEIGNIVSELHGREDSRVRIIWQYNRGDVEMLELGEEMLEEFICQSEIQAIDQI